LIDDPTKNKAQRSKHNNSMSRRRFFAPPEAFNKQTVTLTGDEARHLRDVLRLKAGDEVFVFDGAGKEFRCTIDSARRDQAFLSQCHEIAPTHPESPLQLTLAVALLKGEKFDLVVQKTTELGVAEIVPVMTRNADIHLRDANDAEKRVNRWRRIAIEAAKQCGRAVVPTIPLPISFESLMQDQNSLARFMFSERAGVSLDPGFSQLTTPGDVIALIGSEGGWTDQELASASTAGWQLITLGGRVLRAETAAIAVTALLQNKWGDLR
jgi:16S rRNA (uracil1498-N3)-methyltransferase